jgi:hypothetical protein
MIILTKNPTKTPQMSHKRGLKRRFFASLSFVFSSLSDFSSLFINSSNGFKNDY